MRIGTQLSRVTSQAFRRELEYPGEDDRRHEADRKNDDNVANRGVGETDEREYGFGNLDGDPRYHGIRGPHANHVSAFQLREQRRPLLRHFLRGQSNTRQVILGRQPAHCDSAYESNQLSERQR